MTWFRVDDSFPSHPKVRSIPRRTRMAAVGTWTSTGAWSSHHLTDGLIPADVVEDEGGRPADARALATSGLWHAPGQACDHDPDVCPGSPPAGHYQFHDWLNFNPSREKVLAERKATAERVAKHRAKRAGSDVGNDDGNGVSTGPPSRPVPSRSGGSVPSSSGVPEREPLEPTDDDLESWTPDNVPTTVDLAVEAAAFRAMNRGHWDRVRNPSAAWNAWLAKAEQRNRPTPTPDTPHCPDHPDQPTGSKACPECARVNTPAPDLRALRKAVTSS